MLIININSLSIIDKRFNEILIAECINRVFSILKGLRSQKLERIMRDYVLCGGVLSVFFSMLKVYKYLGPGKIRVLSGMAY